MIGIIGDLHLKEKLGYADYVADGRAKEKQEVLNTIVDSLKDCKTIVFLGDNFHAKNNPSNVIKEFVAFVERFNGKELYFLAGNHEKFGDGRSAIDFLKEVKNPLWHVITNEVIHTDNGWSFCPYFSNPELGVDNFREAQEILLQKLLPSNQILFLHHMIAGSTTAAGIASEFFQEIVFPQEELTSRYQMIIAGHLHHPQLIGEKIVITGSVFTEEVGEEEKFIWKLNEKTMKVKKITLPVYPIKKIIDPSLDDLSSLSPQTITRIILTEKKTKEEKEGLIEILKSLTGYVLTESYPQERRKLLVPDDIDMLNLSIEQLLAFYAQQKKIDIKKLERGWQLIKTI